MAAYQPFQKHIYWNFMESGISGIGKLLNLWVSVRNESGRPYFHLRKRSEIGYNIMGKIVIEGN